MSAEQVSQLTAMFPSWEAEAVRDVIAMAGSLDRAIEMLLEWTAADQGSVTVAAANPRQEGAMDAVTQSMGAMGMSQQPSSAPSIAAGAGGSSHVPVAAPAKFVLRPNYDRVMSKRIGRKCTPKAMVELTRSASILKARAVRARQAIKERNDNSWVAFPVHTPTAKDISASTPSQKFEANSAPLSREDQIVAGKKLLEQRLAFLALKSVDMVDDGNCQFRAISQELWGTQDYHAAVRQHIVKHMLGHQQSYSGFFEASEWKEYIERMGMNKTWGDELTLKAATDAYKVLISSTQEHWYLQYQPEGTHTEGTVTHTEDHTVLPQLFLSYVSPIHYNTVAPNR